MWEKLTPPYKNNSTCRIACLWLKILLLMRLLGFLREWFLFCGKCGYNRTGFLNTCRSVSGLRQAVWYFNPCVRSKENAGESRSGWLSAMARPVICAPVIVAFELSGYRHSGWRKCLEQASGAMDSTLETTLKGTPGFLCDEWHGWTELPDVSFCRANFSIIWTSEKNSLIDLYAASDAEFVRWVLDLLVKNIKIPGCFKKVGTDIAYIKV